MKRGGSPSSFFGFTPNHPNQPRPSPESRIGSWPTSADRGRVCREGMKKNLFFLFPPIALDSEM